MAATTTASSGTDGARSLRHLAGRWSMSKTLTSDMVPVLAMQGVNFLIRRAATAAPLHWEVTETDETKELIVHQSTIAALPASSEHWIHDWQEREYNMGFVGILGRRSRWVKVSDIKVLDVEGEGDGDDSHLTEGLAADEEVIDEEIRSKAEGGWRSRNVWRWEDGNLVRRFVMRKGAEKMNGQMVWEPK